MSLRLQEVKNSFRKYASYAYLLSVLIFVFGLLSSLSNLLSFVIGEDDGKHVVFEIDERTGDSLVFDSSKYFRTNLVNLVMHLVITFVGYKGMKTFKPIYKLAQPEDSKEQTENY